jgi:hypothetical protein
MPHPNSFAGQGAESFGMPDRLSDSRAGALLRFLQRLIFALRLRVADGLCQHLLKFGLGLYLLAWSRFPCRHQQNMGI